MSLRVIVNWTIFCLFVGPVAFAQSVRLPGFVAARGYALESPASWLDQGFGRFVVGAEGEGETGADAGGEVQLALDWNLSDSFRLYLHGSLLAESREVDKVTAGFVEGFLEWRRDETASGTWQIRLGPQILPTSRENTGPLWTSPYTLTGSAINSWIAEEVRPNALDLEWRWRSSGGHGFRLGGTAFYGNDTSGALLSWRGWALHSRLSRWGEVLPLPAVDTLAPGGPFEEQRDDGTVAFGRDLDGNPGFAVRARWTSPFLALVQVSHYDNRGDQRLYRGEYAWATEFSQLGLRLTPGHRWTFLAEVLEGSTAMGFGSVETDFLALYLLASVELGPWRISLRWDDFEVEDVDLGGLDDNNDEGSAWTLALMRNIRESFRLGLEILDVDGADRVSAQESGLDPSTSGRTLQFEARFTW